MRRHVLAALALAALVAPIGLTQASAGADGDRQNPAQAQPPSAPPKSTGLILGQVVDGSTGRPIADAIVTLTQMSGGRGGGNPLATLPGGASPQAQQAMEAAMAAAANLAGRGGAGGPQRVMTGADGRFVFGALPPGSFQVTASLTGYTASLSAGAGGAGASPLASIMAAAGGAGSSAPASLTLKEGEQATGVKMRLWKHAVVSGTVLDDAGEPAIGITVQVARRVMAAGRARYVPGSAAKTDDRGLYRISGLIPGNYIVGVPQTPVAIPTSVLGGLMDSVTGAGPAGGGMAILDLMSSGIDFLGSLGGGVRIDDYLVGSSSGSVPIMGPDGRLQAFQTVFYPGVSAPAQASVVSLASGEERTETSFQLRLIPTSRVSGMAMGPDGPVANLGVRLVVPGDGSVGESEIDAATAVTRSDGTFSFFGVPPGQFVLKAVKQPRPELPAELLASNPTLQAMFGPGGAKGAAEMLFAVANVSVAGSDVDGVALQLAPGFRVSGRLEFESQAGRPQPTAAQLLSVLIVLTPADGRSQGGMLGLGDLTNPDRANAQAEFRTKGYAPGRYLLSPSAPPGWHVMSATIGGRDVLDAPLEIRDADLAGVVVTFTDKMAQVSGTVKAAGETDLSETSVLLFPANHRAWIDSGMNPRRVRTARASRAGAYSVAAVPAGEYLAVAIDRAGEGDMQDPAFIAALARNATRVTVAADPVTLDLTRSQVVVR